MQRTNQQAVWGGIVSDYQDLEQEISQCILTPKGSVPLNPEKGCDLDAFRDRPMELKGALVASEVREALILWVPRIDVSAVLATPKNFSHLLITVTWRPRASVTDEFRNTEVLYEL